MVNHRKTSSFINEPFTDFSLENNRQAMMAALSQVRSELGAQYPLRIGADKLMTANKITSINPANVSEVIGDVSTAAVEHVEQAMQCASQAFAQWKRTAAAERVNYLLDAAALLRERKHRFSAFMVLETGKNWSEADADTAEAIDFLEFYAREMLRLDRINSERPLTKLADEHNELSYIPLGVGAIISPWNFPLAILAGMTAAAIVCGNTVLIKPASPSVVIASKFVELMEEVGLPAGVINFIPGSGAEIGDYMIKHPQLRFINFTGSKEIGLRIHRLAAETAKGQLWLKRVTAELGGKDGIVVDETANVDEAARAIVASAFGFQGQKCSAGSRAIIVQDVYEQVVNKVEELVRKLTIGLPELNYPIGPVIDQQSYVKILSYIEIGKSEGRLLIGGKKGNGNGYFIQPTVFVDVKPKARMMQEEIFGPVLAIAKARDWKEAIAIYNDTEYGLTGSFFSTDEARISYALQEMHCGNLYVNRKCTGALVGAHPFGGFNMSGTDSKAGGSDYLLQFTQAKLISRKIM